MTPASTTTYRPSSPRRLRRKHVLMLALAVEVLVFGACLAGDYRRPGTIVDVPVIQGHVIV